MENIIGVKELRENLPAYMAKVSKGESFMVFKQSKPVFRIVPVKNSEEWEAAVDFTLIQKGGVDIEEVLQRL
jgi:prevent-host-death family protein